MAAQVETLGTGPLEPERLNLRLTYRGVLTRIASDVPDTGFTRTTDLPELSLEDLGAALQHYPSAFIDAVVELSPGLDNCAVLTLMRTEHSALSRYGQLGCILVGALRTYLLPLVLRDVQLECARLAALDHIERDRLSRDVLTYDQRMAVEFGLGRTLRS